jgi:hypothetical protein
MGRSPRPGKKLLEANPPASTSSRVNRLEFPKGGLASHSRRDGDRRARGVGCSGPVRFSATAMPSTATSVWHAVRPRLWTNQGWPTSAAKLPGTATVPLRTPLCRARSIRGCHFERSPGRIQAGFKPADRSRPCLVSGYPESLTAELEMPDRFALRPVGEGCLAFCAQPPQRGPASAWGWHNTRLRVA